MNISDPRFFKLLDLYDNYDYVSLKAIIYGYFEELEKDNHNFYVNSSNSEQNSMSSSSNCSFEEDVYLFIKF